MKLVVSTPFEVVVEAGEITDLRADDETGSFGIRPGHTDFITALAVCVVSWRDAGQKEHYVAVRGGILTVSDGNVAVATRQALAGEALEELVPAVIEKFRRQEDEEKDERISVTRLQLAAIRHVQNYLQAGRRAGSLVAPDRQWAETEEPENME